jgi:two-component system chemotaxis response regulator CheB
VDSVIDVVSLDLDEIDAGTGLGRTSGEWQQAVILLGASTGGCEALTAILSRFPADAPPVVCVQHIPPVFSALFAEHLAAHTRLRVREASSGDVLKRGHVYVAPGGRHLVLREPRGTRLEVHEGPRINRHRPSIDVTFCSAAQRLARSAVAAILSGMGEDGVAGLHAIRVTGGFTLAQDETTSLVFGMPREAIVRGAAIAVAPLDRIANILLGEASRRQR